MKTLRDRIRKRIEQLPVTKQIIDWTRHHSLPGFRNVPIYQVWNFLVQEARRTDLNTRASAMTYHFFLALFPSFIFFFTLTAYLPEEWDFYNYLEQSLLAILPEGAKEYLVSDIINSLRPKAKSSFLSIGFILAVWFGSDGMLALMRGFDKTYKSSFRKRHWLETEITAILLTFGLGILLILSILSLIFGEKILRWALDFIHLGGFAKVAISALNYIAVLILFYAVIGMVYRYGPAIKKPIRGLSPGTLFATLASILTSFLFGVFVDKFGTYHKVYGAVSALIITLIWIRLNTLILILGFELNAAIVINRDYMLQSKINQRQIQTDET